MIKKLSYISPQTEVRSGSVEGKGLFAKSDIQKEEIVAVKSGHVFDIDTRKAISEQLGPAEVQIADNLFIGPVITEERDGAMLYLNHSCEPNLGVQGQIIFVAMRDIKAGEELTFDYAMTNNDDYKMDCSCSTKTCRKTVTGSGFTLTSPSLPVGRQGFRKAQHASISCIKIVGRNMLRPGGIL